MRRVDLALRDRNVGGVRPSRFSRFETGDDGCIPWHVPNWFNG